MNARVRVASCRDDAEAALVRAVLTGHDIDVHISGQHHAALFGLGAAAIELVVWVDAEDAEQAAALITELREGGTAVLADDEIPADDATAREDVVTPGGVLVRPVEGIEERLGRRTRLGRALLLGGLLQHGTAHISVQAYKRGIALAALQITGWRYLAAGHLVLGALAVAAAVVVDMVGAVGVIRRDSPATIPTAQARIDAPSPPA